MGDRPARVGQPADRELSRRVFLENAPDAAFAGHADSRVVVEHVPGEGAFVRRQRMDRRTNKVEGIAHHRRGVEIGIGEGDGREGHVHVAGTDALDRLRRQDLDDPHADSRVSGRHFLDRRDQDRGDHRRRRTDDDQTLLTVHMGPQVLHAALQVFCEAAGDGGELPAVGRRFDMPGRAIEQPQPQFQFQVLDGIGQGRLRHVEDGRRLGETGLFHDGEEGAQLAEGDVAIHMINISINEKNKIDK